MNLTIRIPDALHQELKQYKDEKRPHLSLNALIVMGLAVYEENQKAKRRKPA